MTRYRHQRRGQRDRLPDGVRLVDRSSRWGNPYTWRADDVRWCTPIGNETVLVEGRAEAVQRHADDLAALDDNHLREWLAPLADAVGLACACALDEECHADALLVALDRLHPQPKEAPMSTDKAPADNQPDHDDGTDTPADHDGRFADLDPADPDQLAEGVRRF